MEMMGARRTRKRLLTVPPTVESAEYPTLAATTIKMQANKRRVIMLGPL